MANNILSLRKTSRIICWRPTTEKDIPDVCSIMAEHYFTREPASVALQLSSEDIWSLVNLVKTGFLAVRPALCAYDQETGEMVGVCVTGVKGCQPPDVPLTHKAKQLMKFVDYFTEATKSRGGDSPYITGMIMGVKETYKQMGIAEALYKKRMELARKEGYKFYIVICSSVFTTKAMSNLEAKCVLHLDYAEYVDPITNEKVLKDVAEPHMSSGARLMCLE